MTSDDLEHYVKILKWSDEWKDEYILRSSVMSALQTLHSSTTTSLNEDRKQFRQRNEISVNVRELR